MQRPTGARQRFRPPAPSHFDDGNPISLFGQPMGGDATAKAGSDDYKVKIELVSLGLHVNCTDAGLSRFGSLCSLRCEKTARSRGCKSIDARGRRLVGLQVAV